MLSGVSEGEKFLKGNMVNFCLDFISEAIASTSMLMLFCVYLMNLWTTSATPPNLLDAVCLLEAVCLYVIIYRCC